MSESLATWVPVPVLLGTLALALSAIWLMLRKQTSDLLVEVKALRADMQAVRLEAKDYATKESLTNMGNRFDEKVSALLVKVGVLESKS